MEIKRHRLAAGLTQEEVARHMDVDFTTVCKWENGVSCPRASALPKLADLFHCSIDALYGRDTA